jgi:ABC-type nitrate/sulfonate/bicarbonate transport system permease component
VTAAALDAGPRPAEQTRRHIPQRAISGLAVLAILGLWEVLGLAKIASGNVPAPTQIVSKIWSDGWSFYWPNVAQTLKEAGQGWLWGNGIAIALALFCVLIPFAERAVMRVAIAAYALPIIAIGPILHIISPIGDMPMVALSALTCFFTTLIGAAVGLRSVDKSSMDLIRAYGGGSWTQLVKVRLRAGLPSLFAGLRIAAPTALLGAIIGEYLGADNGMGVAMIASQSAHEVARTWGIATVATVLAGLGYAITAFIGRQLTPWVPRARS